ncbi:MAG: Fe(2+) transporter permease subunit FeoB [Candidatus Sabulitectum sp.]|nr:Fe(2+) transporter permease subunit FeoB [Candidatus Sabulitectum sp.]
MPNAERTLRIAVAGNPNVGKTTLLNALTGSRQHVGNWPGVTVEKIDGAYEHNGTEVKVTDLPGIYSFTAFSIDESIARQFILEEHPDLIVNILDATNLERNLFLTTQLLEMKVPMVVVLNMTDLAARRKIRIEIEHLSTHLGCPVIPIIASRNRGIEALKDAINRAGAEKLISGTEVAYDSVLEKAVGRVRDRVADLAESINFDPRWLALRLLEDDEYARELCGSRIPTELLKEEISKVERHVGDEMDIILADGRYGFIHGLVRDVVHRTSEVRRTVSDRIDKVVLNRMLGIPIFLAVMYGVFVTTINVGGPFIDFFDGLTGTIFVDGFRVLLEAVNLPELLVTFLADGLGGGIQTVATFIPPIFLIFLCLSILEDSGYMARAAFVMDRFLRTIGLPGKAFIPMLVGFGCNVPAIMATRTLESNRDRILAIMMNPFMSCGARLPVYTLFVAAFFPKQGGLVLFSLYLTGILLAVGTGMLFKKTILKGETSTFVMELPPYHLPTLRGIMYHTFTRLNSFILRAGKVIVAVVIVLSFLGSIGTDGSFGNNDSENSVLAAISKGISPVFSPMGLTRDNWPGAVGLFTGIFAKEAVVGTLDNLYAGMKDQSGIVVDDDEPFNFWDGIAGSFAAIPEGFSEFGSSLRNPMGVEISDDLTDQDAAAEEIEVDSGIFGIMREHFDGPVGAYSYLLFILIYAPCVAAIAAIYRETNFQWAALSTAYLSVLAWVVSTLYYQIGTFGSHPASAAMWVAISLGILGAIYGGLRLLSANQKMAA